MNSNLANRNIKLVIIEGIFANFLLGFLFIWTVMRKPLLELFPSWTEGMLSIIFGLHNLFICIGILLGGKLAVKFSGRFVFKLFGIMASVGLAGFALLPENNPELAYVMAFILFVIVAATGIGFGISSVQSHTIPWIPEKSGMVSGIMYMTLGLSSVILTFLSRWILPSLGVKMTMFVFGVIIFVIAAIILLDRDSIKLPPTDNKIGGAIELNGFTPKEMLKSPIFWIYMLWNVGTRTAGLIMLDHVASLSVSYGLITIIGMLISPCNGLGCISLGTSLDKIGSKKIMLITSGLMTLAGVSLVIGHFSDIKVVLLIGILLTGFAYGGSNSTYPAMIKNRFGAKHYTENFGFANLAIGAASFIESASGTALDAAGGNYLSIMIMMLLVTAPSLICAIVYSLKKNN